METIRNYVDTMFINLPRSLEIVKLKDDLLATMEEKYNELKAAGKSENEAIGIVISEFGNIDELMEELGISREAEEGIVAEPMLTEHEVEGYLETKKSAGLQIGVGVAMILTGVASLISIQSLWPGGTMFGLIILFALIVPAVGLFVYSGIRLEQYGYLKDGFTLTYSLRMLVEERKQRFNSSYMLAIIVGVCLCVFSPVCLFLSIAISDDYASFGVSAMLLAIAAAVTIFVYSGNIKDSFSFLLKEGEHKPPTEEDRVIGAVATIVWPLATASFLVAGFLFKLWHIAWIVFPITGILFGMFGGAYNILKKK